MKFELTHFEATVQHFNHYITGLPPNNKAKKKKKYIAF